MVVPPTECQYRRVIRALSFYSYTWTEPHWPGRGTAICLGYGSLFNNSDDDPNLTWMPDPDSARAIVFSAKRDIAVGEELTHSYNWSEEHAKIGFGPTDIDGLPIVESASAAGAGNSREGR
ncbi:hypothetical protein GCM10017771_87680 [Streptomyces capitiformicae]|uniref:SET domain-containing protein n=2 Tax=Streptomyces capitiformicae TaxID=2014920 RepID=A0A919DPA3_9ACTN|nr:hypothetical protein GCM10017771_87680 [Streptomyces capitiformicae]